MTVLSPAEARHLRLRAQRLLLVSSTGTWCAYNNWGGSNHYEGITGPTGSDYSPILSLQRPLPRGFVVLPADAPRAALAAPPAPDEPVSYPHMEWAYANGYSKKYVKMVTVVEFESGVSVQRGNATLSDGVSSVEIPITEVDFDNVICFTNGFRDGNNADGAKNTGHCRCTNSTTVTCYRGTCGGGCPTVIAGWEVLEFT